MNLPRPHYIVDEQGTKVAVILPIEAYERLLEDLKNLASIVDHSNEGNDPAGAEK